ncbi:MAG TPA: hypothetical protein VN685_07920 [Rhizomicrobium sp.]|nr:hypothetical protein [Rhizomicrobium sp.]
MSIARAALAISLLAAVSYWAPAFAVPQDTPTTIDGVKAVCTGVGESKNDPRWRAYPLKLVFANTKGQYTAGERIDITRNGQTMIQTSCDAPWLLLKPMAGNYRVTATLSGPSGKRRASADFTAQSAGPQKTVTLDFPVVQTG